MRVYFKHIGIGGELYFGQGDGCESRVETPWGASHLFQAGFYRLRPRRLQLHPLLDDFMGPGNPWGIAFDEWGQIFSIDGAGGVTFLSPGQVPTTHRLSLWTIGEPGGYCGISYVDGRHLPEAMRGGFVVGDFKRNQVKRFSIEADGAGFSLFWKEPILQSRHRNFRPVDVKVGPDGAIYVVDWYNPITCHQDDAYRDPTRDKAHGRIWRLSARTATIKSPDLSKAPLDEVLDALLSPEHWTRYHAKRAITERDAATVAQALGDWVQSLDPKLPQYEHHLYEALGAYATIEAVEPSLLQRLLRTQDSRARAYAARMVGRWHDRLESPLDLLAPRVVDENPLVRMEAVIACACIPSARSVEVAARVLDEPMDEWTTYAFKQAVHHLQPHWLPAFKRGDVSFAKPSHLAVVLNETGGRDVLEGLKELVDSDDVPLRTRSSAIAAILAVGGPRELQQYGLEPTRFIQSGRYDAGSHAAALQQIIEAGRFRDTRPEGDLAVWLEPLIAETNPQVQASALVLAGMWKVDELRSKVLAAAENGLLPVTVRAAALQAMVQMKLPESRDLLAGYVHASNPASLRSVAVQSLAVADIQVAAEHAAELLIESDLEPAHATATIAAFLDQAGGAEALAASLQAMQLKPAVAQRLLPSLFSTGRSNQVLFGVLNQAIGASSQTPDYSESLVKRLANDATKQGEAVRGSLLFKSMACVSCHKVGGSGGVVGPDLTAIGTTLSAERIVEELLWPNRQVKEGYSVLQVITVEGRILQGYERRTKDSQASGDLIIKELSTGEMITLAQQHIDETLAAGSAMPTGLTEVLSQPQLFDLIRYLSELGKIK